MPSLIPVDHDPFAIELTPVDHDPFEALPQTMAAPVVAVPIVSQKPGIWSDEDEARRQATGINWALRQPLNP